MKTLPMLTRGLRWEGGRTSAVAVKRNIRGISGYRKRRQESEAAMYRIPIALVIGAVLLATAGFASDGFEDSSLALVGLLALLLVAIVLIVAAFVTDDREEDALDSYPRRRPDTD
jgi:hypothetical protein